ncbi:glycosyltransferase [Photobacterium carnosum]|uniref:glycosyltransferase family 2 protein n=1 Tax=Photobacterium carnosum TaxID=2023717 RepID=UPI001E35E56C|nr:glycosyltransferase family 2 protein [Photobacterium carnosum]MCD9544470.1 glycosyltransferase [Photobacterium carnosum]
MNINNSNNENILVSIIVPIYNVENYLASCIESLIEQSHKNIEIILVNDGSPDNSGEISDSFSEMDKRVFVYHNVNSGVSKARNFGLSKAKGDYLVFVDADDFLDREYIRYMLNLIQKDSSEFALSKNCYVYPTSCSESCNSEIEKILTPEDATELLLYPGKVEVGCWNKIYKKKFLLDKEISFSENLYMGEGLNFIVNVAQLSSKVSLGTKKVYYYRKDNVQSATTVLNVNKYINALKAIDKIEKELTVKSNGIDIALFLHRYLTIYATVRAIVITDTRKKYIKEYKEYKKYLRNNFLSVIKSDISIRNKLIIFIYTLNPSFGLIITNLLSRLKRNS